MAGDRTIAPDLRRAARWVPPLPLGHPRLLPLLSWLSRRSGPVATDGVRATTHPGPPAVRVYGPDRQRTDAALLWIHGGGLVLGSVLLDDARCGAIAAELGITVVSVEYRLAPVDPFPAALDDCHAAWTWLLRSTDRLGIDPHRIAVGGASAGAGLAAALAQRLHDEAAAPEPRDQTGHPAAPGPTGAEPGAPGPTVQPAAQWLYYPMLDDRTAARRELDRPRHLVWSNRNNAVGWRSYLGREPGSTDLPPYAAPARREDLAGLPTAWIGVGDVDLFHDEDLAYAQRLRAAGVDVTVDVVRGAPHGFDGWASGTRTADDFTTRAVTWLRTALD
ncbi:alpha/beta hydrolase fold domain-containing protein [Pseudonocardia nantongensis]|uniref:alpha/beta hydrolase n=1 Tax=Pseudonocardia nantongensis TaxID=1181885 RepID=UPI00397B4E47